MSDGSGLLMLAQPFGYWDSVYHEQIWFVSYPGGETVKVTSDLSNYNAALGVSADLSILLSIEYRLMMNIWTTPADDFSQAKQITFGSFGRNDGYTGLAFRHDGKILYTSTTAGSQVVSVMDADGSNAKQITPGGSVNTQLSVSGDGRYVFFHSNRSGLYEIWRMGVDGENPTRMTTSGHNFQSYASPDGKWVYFKSWSDGAGNVWRVPAEGGEPQQITEKECSRFALSPDGRFLACETDGRLVILPAEGGKPLKQFEFPPSSLRWYGMHWTPDSKAVAFRDNFYGIWKQPIETNAPPERIEGLPREKIYRFAWSPDGKQFAFVRGQEIRDVVLFRNLK